MDKEVLKSLVNSLKENDVVGLTFISNLSQYNGEYRVNAPAKMGRGKSGSRILSLTNTTTNVVFDKLEHNGKKHCIGTPIADLLLHVKFGTQQYGSMLESQILSALPKNEAASEALKEALKPLLDKKTPTRLKINSTLPEFNGTWNVVSVKKNSGKFGQISVELDNGTTNVSLWSHRHGPVIKSIEEV